MRLGILLAIAFLLLPLGISEREFMATAEPQPEVKPIAQIPETNFAKYFQELGITGSVLIYDLKNNRYHQNNSQRDRTEFLPASTFKILNALIALETGVIADQNQVFTWDGKQREIPEWNKDLSAKEAFKLSAVWYYQVIARRIGWQRMQEWIEKVGYGNQSIGKKEEIDRFWLEGDLRITPQAQVDFLRRLYQNDLPFSARSLSLVKEMMVVEQTPNYTIRAKTGWVGFGSDRTQIGWYVGYVEKGDRVYIFATNIDITDPKDGKKRGEITRRCLEAIGAL
jgi:beta-lactamase class D